MTSLGDSYGRGFDRGFGYGSGFGDGYGDGSDYGGNGEGYGFGSGFGSGYGDGYGCCYPSGTGYGNGEGYGYGHGSGYSYGSGYGCGDSVLVATLGEREVRAVITPWGRVVCVGCQAHDLDTWREQWREIAREHDVEVSAEEVTRLIALIEAVPLGPEWLPSEEGRRA